MGALADAVESKQSTLEFLLRRMRHQSDLPALSSTISSINSAVSDEDQHANVLCDNVLRDLALTGKLLRLVNAAYYNQFGGSVSTVSRAVAILGYERVRTIAMSLVLFEHLQNKAHAAELKEEIAACYLSGLVACELVEKMGIHDAEEAFICAMFHRLGRLLVAFYLHDECEAIARLQQSGECSAEQAVQRVLGASYAEIGQGVARDWNLPDSIVRSMQPLDSVLRNRPAFEQEKLRALSDLSCRLTDLAREMDVETRDAGLKHLVGRFSSAIALNEKSLVTLLDDAVKSLARDADFAGYGMGKSQLVSNARAWAGHEALSAADADAEALMASTQLEDAGAPGLFDEPDAAHAAEHRRTVLSAGVQDITNTLVGEYQLNDVLRIILETMYRAIGFKRVLLCIRDNGRNVLRSRFGFGKDVEKLIHDGFAIPLDVNRDVFYAAISQGVDICIENLSAENIQRHVPEWYRKTIEAHGMVLFPILLRKRVVALIYADTDDAARLRFAPEELNLLKTLRNQAVLAIKQNG
jgi:HD-like signal output (HDOD) protein